MKLEFELPDYCDKCPCIELEVSTTKYYAGAGTPFEVVHTLTCKSSEKCAHLYALLTKKEGLTSVKNLQV